MSTTLYQLNPEIRQKLKQSKNYRLRLALINDVSERTIQNWLNTNHVMLTTIHNLEFMYNTLGLKPSDGDSLFVPLASTTLLKAM